MKSVEERLAAVSHLLVLVQAGLAIDNETICLDEEEILEALIPQVREIADHVFWVKQALSADVLNAKAPTNDERNAAEARAAELARARKVRR